jgi:hypothetical protein
MALHLSVQAAPGALLQVQFAGAKPVRNAGRLLLIRYARPDLQGGFHVGGAFHRELNDRELDTLLAPAAGGMP